MKVRPLHDRILVRRVAEEEKTKGGIIIPDTAKEKPAEGEVYQAVETARGEFGMYIVSQGDVKPYRIKLRTPSFANMSIFPEMAQDNLVADLVANLGSIDVVIPEIDR